MKSQVNLKQAMRRYFQEFFLAILMYMVILMASVTLLKNYEVPRVWQIIISLSPAVPIAFVVITLMRLLADSDELQQRVNLYAITFSAVLTGLLTFSYGLLENVGFPKMSTFTVFPMLSVLWGIGLGYFTKRYE